MKLELHILQNFAPSCLNRDDTNAPKDCEFGGVRRARISSQCLKRSIRQAFAGLIENEEKAVRTKRLVEAIGKPLAQKKSVTLDVAMAVAKHALEGAGLGVSDAKEGLKTQYLLFLPARTAEALATVIAENWDIVHGAYQAVSGASESDGKAEGGKAKAKTSKQKKSEAQAAFPDELRNRIQAMLENGQKTPEIALFGRMIADKPHWNIDAACQVAHALSTHRVTMDFDFYTAVDDLKPGDSSGADMMGTVQFNSACFYRYAVVDIDELAKNLGGNDALKDPAVLAQARKTLDAFLHASVVAIPTGKQNSMAAHNPPGLIMAVVRDGGAPWSLANAFERPIATRESGLLGQSIQALQKHFEQLTKMYGTRGIRRAAWCTLDEQSADALKTLGDRASSVESVDELVQTITTEVFGQ